MHRVAVISSHLTSSQDKLTTSTLKPSPTGWIIVQEPANETIVPNVSLRGKTVFITGGSRGIGLAIGLACAREGANIVLAAKTTEEQPTLEGTIFTAAAAVEKAGGQALPVKCDVRDEASVVAAVEAAVKRFGGIDVLINNASAIQLAGTLDITMKRYDLLQQVDGRATFMVSQKCLPHLIESAAKGRNPHILTISPPPTFDPRWYKNFTAYTMAKMSMTLCTIGLAAEFKKDGVAANTLWPRTSVATAAVQNLLGGDDVVETSRTPEVMADAAVAVLKSSSKICTAQHLIDDVVLSSLGVSLEEMEKRYSPNGLHSSRLAPDFFC